MQIKYEQNKKNTQILRVWLMWLWNKAVTWVSFLTLIARALDGTTAWVYSGGEVKHDRKPFTSLQVETSAAHSAAVINLLFK